MDDVESGLQLKCNDKCNIDNAKEAKKRARAAKKLSWAVGLCVVFIIGEVIGGVISNSLAILTDAAHLLSDIAGFAIALFAIYASGWEATPRQTFGYYRLEILGALVSIQIVWLVTGVLVYEAILRFVHPDKNINGLMMFCVACGGLGINIIIMFTLGHEGHGHSHNHDHDHGHSHEHSNEHHHEHNQKKKKHHFQLERNEEHKHLSDHEHDKPKKGFNVLCCFGTRKHHHNLQSSNKIPSSTDAKRKETHHKLHDHDHDHDHDDDHDDEDNDVHEISIIEHHKEEEHNNNHLKHNTRSTSVKLDKDLHQPHHHPKHEAENMNIRAAYLHAFGDFVQSIGVMIAGVIIWIKPEFYIVDPICTIAFSVMVLATTYNMIREIVSILMESTPREIDASALEAGLLKLDGVVEVHELHIWAITVGRSLLACHIQARSHSDTNEVLHTVTDYVDKVYNISHVTIQVEQKLS